MTIAIKNGNKQKIILNIASFLKNFKFYTPKAILIV